MAQAIAAQHTGYSGKGERIQQSHTEEKCRDGLSEQCGQDQSDQRPCAA